MHTEDEGCFLDLKKKKKANKALVEIHCLKCTDITFIIPFCCLEWLYYSRCWKTRKKVEVYTARIVIDLLKISSRHSDYLEINRMGGSSCRRTKPTKLCTFV